MIEDGFLRFDVELVFLDDLVVVVDPFLQHVVMGRQVGIDQTYRTAVYI